MASRRRQAGGRGASMAFPAFGFHQDRVAQGSLIGLRDRSLGRCLPACRIGRRRPQATRPGSGNHALRYEARERAVKLGPGNARRHGRTLEPACDLAPVCAAVTPATLSRSRNHRHTFCLRMGAVVAHRAFMVLTIWSCLSLAATDSSPVPAATSPASSGVLATDASGHRAAPPPNSAISRRVLA